MKLSDKDIVSIKLWKQIKALERQEKHVLFNRTLDAVGFIVNDAPKKRKSA